MSSLPDFRATPPVEDSWTTQDAAELYRVADWGGPYFRVNDAGRVAVRASGESASEVELPRIVEALRERGVQLPVLIRFQDILRAQVKGLNQAFADAIAACGYGNFYRGVYPVKVNQLHEVVDELLDAGRPYGMGLECGSKAELIAALPRIDGDTLLVCNGVKDRSMLALMLAGQRLGQNVIPVIERYAEFVDLERVALHRGRPVRLGARIRLATRGSGLWAESSGASSKFGLSVAELLRLVRALEASRSQQRLVLLHCHIGSQVVDIASVERATREATQIYAQLARRGVTIEYLDLGGGLGISYDRWRPDQGVCVNYSLREYAEVVVRTVKSVCEESDVPPPVIVTESGRVMTAYHSVLITPVVGAHAKDDAPASIAVGEDAVVPVRALARMLARLPAKRGAAELLALYRDASARLDNVHAAFARGCLDLEQRSLAETLYWRLCERLRIALDELPVPDSTPPQSAELEGKLADQYLCDFSVFQSMLDHWALGQTFPIMPIDRLDERPTRHAVLVDLTCDSDGKVHSYVSNNPDHRHLPIHALEASTPYLVGFFLLGAYEDIVGDAHNLFGRVTEAHVYADSAEPGNFWIEKIIHGTAVQEMLAQVRCSPGDLHRRMSDIVHARIRSGDIGPAHGMRILDQYRGVFTQTTYCNANDMARGHRQ